MTPSDPQIDNRQVARLLHDLGRAIRDGVIAGRILETGLHAVERTAASDTIYRIDRIGEEALLKWFAANWPEHLPIDIVAEGLGDESGERFPESAPEAVMTVLIDPIDGTRGLMHDKRSAWVLAGAAWKPMKAGPLLGDLVAGSMVEIPVTRQAVSDSTCGWLSSEGCYLSESAREREGSGQAESITLRSSFATDLRHGFATFASYFPEGREEIVRIEKEFLSSHLPETESGSPLVFADQYISSGGQVFELLSGRDRMVADLRPLVFQKLGIHDGLTCHPYDLACLPAAFASGCIFEDPFGGPIRAPVDTTSPVAWVGYANEKLAGQLRPLLIRALEKRGFK